MASPGTLWRTFALVLATTACGSATLTVFDEEEPPEAPPAAPPEAPPSAPPQVPEVETPRPQGPPTDAFGVVMLHPTKPGGETWRLAADPLADLRFNPDTFLTRNPDGSWKVRSTQVRMEVLTSTGYKRSIPTFDRKVLAGQGFMLAPNDWKNVEMTGYVRLNSASTSTENFAWYARGGVHEPERMCEGSSYKGALHYDGRARWLKESWHVSYAPAPYADATSPLLGRWVGIKAIMRNVLVGKRTGTYLALWIDEDEDPTTWKKVYEMTDTGAWGGASARCGGTDGMPLTWGGPIATFRWDGATDVDFKWLSVREIQ